MKNCTLLWREAHFEVKMYKTHHGRSTFGSCDVEKVHAVVARSTFPSENVKNTRGSDHFWKLRCRKSATPLWREAHFQVKMYKTHQVPDQFWQLRCRKSARRCGAKHIPSQNVKNTTCSCHFWKFRSRKSARRLWREAHFEVKMLKTLGFRTTFGGSDVASLRFTTLHYIRLHYTPLHLHYTTLHSTTLQLQLHSTTLNLHYATLHYTALHYATLHYTTLPSTTLYYITPHSTTLHYNYNYNYTTTLH